MSTKPIDKELQDKLDNLNSHLVMINSLKQNEAEDEYYVLMQKGKQILGQLSPLMAKFYLEYGSFLLSKVQNSMNLFNPDAVPQAGEDDEIPEYDQAYEDQSEVQKNGANAEKVQQTEEKTQKKEQNQANTEQKQEKVIYEDENVQITEGLKQKMEQKNQQQKQPQDDEEDLTDLELAYQHFQVALSIYEKERERIENGQQSVLDKNDIFKAILCLHGRLGDLFMLDERFQDCINEYNAVVKLTKYHDNPEVKRRASEAYFNIGNCLMYENKQDCQVKAIHQYSEAVLILLKYIEQVQNYNISKFELPSEKKPRIDRFAYLGSPFDSDLVKDIKEVASIILDKIEDTYDQIGVRKVYEQEKAKMNKQKEESGFKEVSKDVKVTNLGTFGNRKKTPAPSLEDSNKSLQKKMTSDPETSIKMKQTPKGQSEQKESTNASDPKLSNDIPSNN